ncbi:hypothetical protein L207DRAFT_485588 [Hyaloscypha variabilis F]|uniref:Arrestin-like N-terminal domain-containing protein n=1 Tax=Hyaloscypha variabilis (strain UAMH 11265 / GT02V1 / F) TaxID=1149755 RepID=A0A2J6RUD8_HYAVF|nr:hypothetical protein L207DRAFT_485588 [Hyaloscypha variabilis F]
MYTARWLQRRQEKPQRPGRILQRAMSIQIILPEDTLEAKPNGEPMVRHSGDEIRGHLEVTTRGNFEFEVSLSFEGLVRTWFGFQNDGDPCRLPPTAEFQFLQETQKLYSDPSSGSIKDQLRIHRLPFQFVVPHELISARSDVHPDFLKLCPSTKQGPAFCSLPSRKVFRQPLILYAIRIKHIRTDKVVENFMRSTYHREIAIMPHIPPAPPLAMEAFIREYKPSTMRSVRQHRWTRLLGTLRLSAAEPSPVNILSSGFGPSTVVTLSLAFAPNGPCGSEIWPCEWSCVVSNYLRIRTFYSTQRMERMPTLSEAKRDSFLRVHEMKTALEVREHSELSWNNDDACQWSTKVNVPIRVMKNLLPTFLNQLSARQYAVVIRLAIKGLSHGLLELVLPLQVIYYPTLSETFETPHREGTARDELLSSDVDFSPPSYDS